MQDAICDLHLEPRKRHKSHFHHADRKCAELCFKPTWGGGGSLQCCNEGRHAIRFWPSRRNFEFPEAQLGDIRQERKIEKGAAFFPQRWGYFLHLRNCQKQVTVEDLFPRKWYTKAYFQEASGGRKLHLNKFESNVQFRVREFKRGAKKFTKFSRMVGVETAYWSPT